MDSDNWPTEWGKGTLEHAVLAVVAAHSPTYGYAIAQRLKLDGWGEVKGGTLYPVLARLEQKGDVESHWGDGAGGPGRKFIAITEHGQERLSELHRAWKLFSKTFGRLLEGEPR